MPLSYFVPHGGMVQRRRVHDRRQLRGLRTELALLGQIDSLITSGMFDDFPVNPCKYDQRDREELSDIIRSATDPMVRSMIDVVDHEFGSIREEIMMSVVQDEAERIVAEAAESGTDLTASADPGAPSDPPPASPVEPGVTADVETPSEPTAAEPVADDTESADDATSSQPVDGVEAAEAPTTNAETTEPAVEEAIEPVDNTPEPEDSFEQTTISESVADATEETVDVEAAEPEPVAVTPNADVIKMAEQAVAEIEEGVARLADALGISTRFQNTPLSTHAADATAEETTVEKASAIETTVDETPTAPAPEDHQAINAVHDEGAEILAQIKAFHEEVRVARDETDVARQEASSFREDARRAKQRSEASAEAAERSADDAAQEARNACASAGATAEPEVATASLP